jgi:hypothetical protein
MTATAFRLKAEATLTLIESFWIKNLWLPASAGRLWLSFDFQHRGLTFRAANVGT